MLPHVYRVTKYDPADRDERGHYVGAEDTTSDHGPVEAAYLEAAAAFAADSGVDSFAIRDPEIAGHINFGLEAPIEGHGTGRGVPARPHRLPRRRASAPRQGT